MYTIRFATQSLNRTVCKLHQILILFCLRVGEGEGGGGVTFIIIQSADLGTCTRGYCSHTFCVYIKFQSSELTH